MTSISKTVGKDMRNRDKFLKYWLIFVGIAVIYRYLSEGYPIWRDPFNPLLAFITSIALWYWLLKFIFWIYDRIVRKVKPRKEI